MRTVLSKKWRVEIPEEVRMELKLAPGDRFEVMAEDDDTIVLYRVNQHANEGLIELLRACPGSLDILEREKDDTEPLSL